MPASEIMHKFYHGTLHSGSGAKVEKLSQAKAIAAQYNEHEYHEHHNSMKHAHLASDGSIEVSHCDVKSPHASHSGY